MLVEWISDIRHGATEGLPNWRQLKSQILNVVYTGNNAATHYLKLREVWKGWELLKPCCNLTVWWWYNRQVIATVMQVEETGPVSKVKGEEDWPFETTITHQNERLRGAVELATRMQTRPSNQGEEFISCQLPLCETAILTKEHWYCVRAEKDKKLMKFVQKRVQMSSQAVMKSYECP